MKCKFCNIDVYPLSKNIPYCMECLRKHFQGIKLALEEAHAAIRKGFGLPPHPPKAADGINGIRCTICFHECYISEGQAGYCGVRRNEGGYLVGGSPRDGNLSYYYDPLPTNCVADWVCPGGTGCGYPKYAYKPAPEYGYKNLAVFYNSCTFDCLYCQNWHFRELVYSSNRMTAEELASCVDSRTSCLCFFGGDPTPQLPHSLRTAEIALSENKGRILRICWETNGSMHPKLFKRATDIAIKSGGIIKFDLKAWDEGIHWALCGVSNRRTLENFSYLATRAKERPEVPLAAAATLMVPGYIDRSEVYNLAKFIAGINPEVPYSLLAFHPTFFLNDLPRTSKELAKKCYEAAIDAGLKKVRIGNIHLLT